jgi:hypothetical protein
MADDTTQADGYYGDDELNNDEIDLSFLDEKDDKDEDKQ